MRISTQRWLALAMVWLECSAIGFLSQTVLFPTAVAVVAGIGVMGRWRVEVDRQRTYDVLVLLGMIFAAKYMVVPDNPRYTDLFSSQQMAFVVSQYVLTIQALQFFVQRRDNRLPFMFPGIGVIALVCAAIVQLSGFERTIFQIFCVTFAVLAALYCDASRRFIDIGERGRAGRPLASAVVLICMAAIGWGLASGLHRFERTLDDFVMRWLSESQPPRGIGFTDAAYLGSVNATRLANSRSVALRVRATTRPGYFRGRAYDLYQNHKWLSLPAGSPLPRITSLPRQIEPADIGGNLFELQKPSSSQIVRQEVWPSVGFAGTLFAPTGTMHVQARARLVTRDAHEILRTDDAAPGSPYAVFSTFDAPPITRDAMLTINPQLLEVPDWATRNAVVRQLAWELCGAEPTVRDKVNGLQRYFRHKHKYSLQFHLPPNVEPIEWFLTTHMAAHCEYFASAATILLRMSGVPARYVSGFVIDEQNRFSGHWIARHKDAHAWTEALDEHGQWITVECTPSTGVPQADAPDSSAEFWEYVEERVQRARVSWQQQGLAAILRPMIEFFNGWGGIVLFAIAGCLALRPLARRFRIWRLDRRDCQKDPHSLSGMLIDVDRVVGRNFRSRLPTETLDRFATALDHAAAETAQPSLHAFAAWYRTYQQLRYGACGSLADGDVQTLFAESRRIQQVVRNRSSGNL